MTRILRPVICLILCIILGAAGIFGASQYFMSVGFEEMYTNHLNAAKRVVDEIIDVTKMRLSQEVVLLSVSREVEHAFLSHETAQMKKVIQESMRHCKASFMTVVDAEGIVLARGHSEQTGDSIRDSEIMRKALQGITSASLIRLKNNGLSIAAAAPVYINNQLVGAILTGDAFRTGHFVDTIKDITNFDMTVFDNDKRLSTTICRNGCRAINTVLENQNVIANVLQYGHIFQGDTTILGQEYKALYWPLEDDSGKILGSFFLGIETEAITSVITATAALCLTTSLCIVVLLSIAGTMLLQSILKPLERRAALDKLTGVSNRAEFERQILKLFATTPKRGTLFIIDLDNFKQLNDTFGHPEGDACLRTIGKILKTHFRETDLVARLGGDEFIVYSPSLFSLETVQQKTEHLLSKLSCTYRHNEKEISVTASIGIIICTKEHISFEDMYAMADSALYNSKTSGRNQYTIAEC